MNGLEITFDKDGNELSFDGLVYRLKLLKENGAQRNIGEIVKVRDKVYMVSERNFKKHFYRKSDSWGFSERLIDVFMETYPDGFLAIRSDVGKFSIRARDAISVADYLYFKTIGFELQRMIHHSNFIKSEITDVFTNYIKQKEQV